MKPETIDAIGTGIVIIALFALGILAMAVL